MDDKDKSALDQFVDIYREVLATTPTARVTGPRNEQMLVRDEGPTASETTPAPKQTTRANKGAAKRSARLNKPPALEKDAAKRASTKKAKKAPKKTAKKAAKKSAVKAITKKSRRGVKKQARRV